MSVFGKYKVDQLIEDEIANSTTKFQDTKDNDLVIAVMPANWVFVGFVTKLNNERIRLDCCHNIHYWGTTEGLGELAKKGPLPETKLNESGPIIGKPLFLIAVDESNWL